MGAMASQITSLRIVYSTVYSGADQRKHQSSMSLAFVRGIHLWPVNSPRKWPVTRRIFPFDDVIINCWMNAVPETKPYLFSTYRSSLLTISTVHLPDIGEMVIATSMISCGLTPYDQNIQLDPAVEAVSYLQFCSIVLVFMPINRYLDEGKRTTWEVPWYYQWWQQLFCVRCWWFS